MRILVVYDSYYGNTRKIAEAVAAELSRTDEAVLVKAETGQYIDTSNADLLVVGSPTRAFSATPPVKEFLKQMGKKDFQRLKLAFFDTRIDPEETGSRFLKWMMRGFGYANDTMLKLVRSKGGRLACDPAGFFVEDKEGPLAPGELKRASAWAGEIRKAR